MSDSLWLHGLQCTRLPCPLPTPGAYSNSCPSSQWCHPTISSSAAHSPPAFNHSQHQGLFKWVSSSQSGGQSIGVSALATVLPMTIQDWCPLGWTGWISLQSKGLSRVFSNTTVQKYQFLYTQLSLWSVQLSHPYITIGKTRALTRQIFVGKVMSLIFNILLRLIISFLPRSKHRLISWLQSPSAVGTRCHDLSFLNVELSANFFILLFHFHQEAL